ncbi:MAG: hypothetical protein AB199_01450 [Parcubacteria bacterium C7867-004]|nr:MAG: hypothetical protein AB199_01450 [Parcubacteria bacterium C7867-004]
MELFLPTLANNRTWRRYSKTIVITGVVFWILRITLQFGFTNPLADAVLGFFALLLIPAIFIVFPYRALHIVFRILIALFLFALTLISLLFLLFQSWTLRDTFNRGENPWQQTQDVYDENPFLREVVYVGDCGATCASNTYGVKELMLIPYVLKFRIPGTFVDLPH